MVPALRPRIPVAPSLPVRLVLAVFPMVLALAMVACAGGDDDRLDASELVVVAREADPELSEEEAVCLVERTSERLGVGRSEELAREGFAGSGLSDEVATIRDGCLGSVAATETGDTTPPTVPGAGAYPVISPDAQRYGDDPTLDRLWDECEAGSGRACDDLYYLSPLDSEYEAFGYSCGNRENVILCSELDR